MESFQILGMNIKQPKYGKGQVVRFKEFKEVKLQIISVNTFKGNYTCVCQDGKSYKTDDFEEEFIEPHPDFELLPAEKNVLIERYRDSEIG